MIVGEPISFAVDEKFFPNPYTQAQSPFGLPVVNQKEQIQPVFRWDFKDGTEKAEGNPITHTFTKPGTYIIELEAKYPGKDDRFSQVNTIQANIIPEAGYELPTAVITIGKTTVHDPLIDTVTVQPVTPTLFDASSSKGSIVSYAWDFGDDKKSEKQSVKHRYARDIYFPTVVLRVTDKNNLISDTYALVDLPFEKPNPVMVVVYSIMDFVSGLFYRD